MTSQKEYLTAGRTTSTESGLHKLVERVEAASRRPIRVVIADDEILNHDIYQAVLSGYGISHIQFAEDGQEALDAVDTHQPDIVFLDTNMPRMEGHEACKRLRQKYGADLRIVGMSSLSLNEKLWEGSGADHYVNKDVLCGTSKGDNLGNYLKRMLPRDF
jgi:CheY-like chemotaxis protein